MSAYSDAVLADAPLAYWRMGDVGTTLTDSSGNGRSATLTSATGTGATGLLATDADKCWDAPGNTYGSVADAAWLDASAFTVEALIVADVLTSYRTIIARDGISTARGWAVYINAGKLTLYDFNSGLTAFAGATTLVTGNTYHLAVTYDGTNARVYVNGVLDGTSGTATVATSLSNPLLIGASYGGSASPTFFHDGRLDEVAYYGTALSATRIAAHANSVLPGSFLYGQSVDTVAAQSGSIITGQSADVLALQQAGNIYSQSIDALIVADIKSRINSIWADTITQVTYRSRVSSMYVNVIGTGLALVAPPVPVVSVWNGIEEVPAVLRVWNGAAEEAADILFAR